MEYGQYFLSEKFVVNTTGSKDEHNKQLCEFTYLVTCCVHLHIHHIKNISPFSVSWTSLFM